MSPFDGLDQTAAAARAIELAAIVDEFVARGAATGFPDEALQQALSALVRLYVEKHEAGQRILPFGENAEVSATAVLIMAGALLKGANLQLFELGMWQSWSGNR